MLKFTRDLRLGWCLKLVLVLSFLWVPVSAQQPQSSRNESRNAVQPLIDQAYPFLERLYHYFHSHPELSFHEKETSARLAGELKAMGFDVFTHIGGYGVVGIVKNGKGPTVMIRTDMDALPITEATGLPYASRIRTTDEQGRDVGVMHACGHDVHMTVFVGTAYLLMQLTDRWSGTLMMVGQPAEEKEDPTPSLYNDPVLTERLVRTFETALGKENVVARDPEMIGEDFARYGRKTFPLNGMVPALLCG